MSANIGIALAYPFVPGATRRPETLASVCDTKNQLIAMKEHLSEFEHARNFLLVVIFLEH